MREGVAQPAATGSLPPAPLEIRLASALIGGIGAAFALIALLRLLAGAASANGTVTPVLSAVLGGAVAWGLLAGRPAARVTGLVVLVLFGLLHALIAVSSGPWWIRVFSALAAAGYLYSGVLLGTRPAREYLTKETP